MPLSFEEHANNEDRRERGSWPAGGPRRSLFAFEEHANNGDRREQGSWTAGGPRRSLFAFEEHANNGDRREQGSWTAGGPRRSLFASRAGVRRAPLLRSVARGAWAEYRSQRGRSISRPHFVPSPHLWPDQGLFAAWLGHSTVLLKVDGVTILTDPVLGDRCGVSVCNVTVGLKRLVASALDVASLPRIDLILLSHAHLDHFDTRTLRLLDRPHTTVITARSTSDLLRRRQYREIRELGWDEETRLGPLHIRGFRVRHWGARMQTDMHRGYNGYLIETDKRRIVFGGDTAMTDSFRALRSSRPVDLAIMPIGAYNPWIGAHCNPEQAMQMANDCGASFVLPVHHQTFHLSREPYREPVERMLAAAGASHHRISLTEIGQEWQLQ